MIPDLPASPGRYGKRATISLLPPHATGRTVAKAPAILNTIAATTHFFDRARAREVKNIGKINALGTELSRSYDISFLEADFKKKDGFLKSVQKSKDLGLYRQDYCGCCYSMRTS